MSETKDYKKIKETYYTLVDDETEYGIVTALNWYETLNLKKIAVMLDKPESTTLRYIRKLKDKGLIELDSKKSEDSWGKYYKLSKSAKKVYDEYMQSIDEQIENIADELKDLENYSEEELEKLVISRLLTEEKLNEIPFQKHYFQLASNLQIVMMNEAINKIEEFKELLKNKDKSKMIEKIKVSPIDISIYVNQIKISKWSHIFKINNLIFRYLKQLEKLKKDIEKEMEKENVPEDQRYTQFVNVFTGNLDVSYRIEE
jgi:DNA-binding transcriptional ArsR family regulator